MPIAFGVTQLYKVAKAEKSICIGSIGKINYRPLQNHCNLPMD